jgi:predicted chitinase/lysozyme family protein
MPRAIDIVRKVAPKARENYLLAFERGDALLKKHGITTPPRLAHFLAQVLHETGELTIEWESGSYSAPRLLEIFGVGHHSAGVTPGEASALAHHPEAIFERVYGLGNPKKAKELGNAKPGDGFRYRGGGILQTTGRGNYRRMGQKCGVDFEASPELVLSAEHALKPALAEWSEGNLNAAADRDDIVAITRKINGGLNGLDDRRNKLAKLKPLIKSVELVEGAEAPGPTPTPTDLAPHTRPAAPSIPGPTPTPAGSDLARLVIAAMERKGYQVDRGPGELNIVYVEGMNPDGTPNSDEANKWNDLRLVIKFEGGEPRIVGSWAATTEPGRYWTQNPMSPLGAARIEFGQYKVWQVGMHRGNHESLVQTGGKVTVCRDLNKDGMRTGDTRQTGEFGINQHWGYDLPEVEKASAGCLVGQSKNGHRDFMAIVKSDPRYQANRKYVFATAILPESDVLAEGPAVVAPGAEPGDEAPLVPSDVSDDVRRWQKLLGFSEEEQDGLFGAITEEAVKRFQRRHGLTVTGDMDDKTRDTLEREAAGALGGSPTIVKPPETAKPAEPALPIGTLEPFGPGAKPTMPAVLSHVVPIVPSLGLGVGAMNPLIMIAARVLPDIVRAVVGDKAGTVAGAVSQAVTDITRTKNPEEAKQKLETDPAALAALQLKLAEIASEQEDKRQQAQLALLKEQNEQEAKKREAQLALLKEQNEQEAKKREAQLAQFRAEIEDTKGARAAFSALALANNPMAWGAPVVSIIVTIGFFGILTILIFFGMQEGTQVAQIINITVGALAAAFATVVSFWLGSSQGSRQKEAASIQLQAEQTESQVKQAEALRNTVQAQAKQAEALATMKTAVAVAPTIGAPKPSNFQRCFDIVLGYEGGYSEEPGDPSGATQFGVTIGALRDFRQDQTLGIEDLKKLGRDEACEIYRTRYWNVLRCDDLPNGVDLVVFDFAVDANAGRAARALQQVVGAEADGSIGDATLAATKVKPARDVVKGMSDRRLEYYRALSDAANFIKGAMSRTNAVEKAALDMIAAERPAAP